MTFSADEVRWRAINSTFGVSRIVTFGSDYPAQVPPVLMGQLLARCDQNGRLLPPDALAPGDQVRILKGPLSDFVGTVEQISPQQRVWLLLEFMGRATRTVVEWSDVKKVAASAV